MTGTGVSARLKQLLFFSCSAGALGAAQPALAQQAPGAPSIQAGEEIVVTAQKREQRLLDVPVAVSAVTADTLTQQNLVSIRDFYTRIPGIQLSGSTTQDISLRGVNAGGGTNPTVSILIDDVQFGSSTYLGRLPTPDLDPAILDRIEVLRGPQGTLYGASSLGGLIKYVTRDPSTSRFWGRVEAGFNTVADGGQGWSVRGSVNAPIIRDKIGLSVSGFYRDNPRYIDNIVPAGTGTTLVKDANKNVSWGGRAALLLKPTERLSVKLAALYQKQDAEALDDPINICSACSRTSPMGTPITFDPRKAGDDLRTSHAAVVPTTNEFSLYSGRVLYDLDAVQITSVTAWGRNKQRNSSDATNSFAGALETNFGPGTPTPVYPAGGTYLFGQPLLTNKFTQELRLSGSGAVADWLVGVFYTNERSKLDQNIDRVGTPPNLRVYAGANDSTYKEKAVFGDVTFHVADRFDVQLGGRYAANRQTYLVKSTIDPAAQFIFGPNESSLFRSKEHAFTWLVAPTYKFNPNLMAYVRVAKGYRPGGPNTDTPGATASFAPDTVVNYEAGLKGAVLDKKLTFDIAAFRIDWSHIQLQNTALPSQFVFFENGDKARSSGLEVQTTARPWTGFSIDANATVLDAKLTRSIDPTTSSVQRLLGQAGDRLPYSAKFSGNLSMQQDFTLSDRLAAYAGFNVNYVGNRYGLFNQNSPSAIFQRAKLPSYTTVDLRAGVTVDEAWRLDFYVRNLFDKIGFTSVNSRNGTAPPQAVLITPRTIGVTASLKF